MQGRALHRSVREREMSRKSLAENHKSREEQATGALGDETRTGAGGLARPVDSAGLDCSGTAGTGRLRRESGYGQLIEFNVFHHPKWRQYLDRHQLHGL